MSVFDERPGSMRGRRSNDQGQFQIHMEPAPTGTAKTRTGRKLGGVDNGTVALAISGMSFYWMMPMLMSPRKRRRKHPPADSGSARE
ncbi:MAG: hypothetical protein LC118_06805 [Dehalococcoidia bacterium]|nr:hypothetical protein [Dehalococcoidia bacterium]